MMYPPPANPKLTPVDVVQMLIPRFREIGIPESFKFFHLLVDEALQGAIIYHRKDPDSPILVCRDKTVTFENL